MHRNDDQRKIDNYLYICNLSDLTSRLGMHFEHVRNTLRKMFGIFTMFTVNASHVT